MWIHCKKNDILVNLEKTTYISIDCSDYEDPEIKTWHIEIYLDPEFEKTVNIGHREHGEIYPLMSKIADALKKGVDVLEI